ncbi:MAG: DoxX family protein [Deltaproteobacteria bacterium]|nr:DoxX family protein [Deltaproteobacteria bacterium]
MLGKIFNRFGGYTIIVLRIALGAIFIAHGGQKLFGLWGGPSLSGFTQSMENLGLPFPGVMALVAGCAEFFGGLMVLLGFYARWGALFILGVMAVAVYTIHWKNGFFLQNQGYEYNLAIVAMCISILFASSGRWSIKHD